MIPHRSIRQPVWIHGTSRQRVTASDGVELERQQIYLSSQTWNSLEMLARLNKTSGSKVINRLIENAVKACQVN
jgi:PIN domain nuclease of toxin-antitoxin system